MANARKHSLQKVNENTAIATTCSLHQVGENSSAFIMRCLSAVGFANKKSVEREEKNDFSTSANIPPFVREISRYEIKFLKPLGRGVSAAVWSGKWNNMDVAIKSIHRFGPSEVANKESFDREVSILSTVNHESIIKMHGVIKLPVYSIVLERLPGDLFDLIEKNQSVDYVSIGYDVASALDYLHKKNIIHHDIKTENILINDDGHAKLCDFGFAVKLDSSSAWKSHQFGGTLAYLAPETLTTNGYFSKESDIYAFGVLLWEMVTRQSFMWQYYKEPFRILDAVKAGERAPIPRECDADIAQLIQQCWSQQRESRPTAGEVVTVLFKKLSTRQEGKCEAQQLKNTSEEKSITSCIRLN